MPTLRHILFPTLLAAGLTAQAMVVDYPDSTLGAPAGQYPIYTGTGLNVIRGQSFCPTTFGGLPTQPMLCTRIGIQLAEVTGPVRYAQFVMRAGATQVTALTTTFATNLPDQRVQLDLSGQTLAGGPNANIWVEYPLAFPFYWQPGDGVVIDFTTQTSVAGQYLRTAIGTGVPRCISTNYTGSGTGSASTSGGIKFRMVFEPLDVVQWGIGCAGTGNFVPAIGSVGTSNVGSNAYAITLTNALGGTLAGFTIGLPADFAIGGGCHLYNDMTGLVLLVTTGAGPGTGAASVPLGIPNNPLLRTMVVDVQWGVLDPSGPSFYGTAMSPGGKIVVY